MKTFYATDWYRSRPVMKAKYYGRDAKKIAGGIIGNFAKKKFFTPIKKHMRAKHNLRVALMKPRAQRMRMSPSKKALRGKLYSLARANADLVHPNRRRLQDMPNNIINHIASFL